MKNIYLVGILLLAATSCEYVIGESNVTDASFSEMQISKTFDFKTTNDLDFIYPNQHTTHLADVFKSDGEQTSFLGTYNLNESSLQVEVDITANEIFTVPLGASRNGDYQFNIYVDQYASKSKAATVYSTLGDWDKQGVPKYLEKKRDNISDELLDDINASLPEGKPVPEFNPGYLNGLDMNTVLVEDADVWITFVHEGAGYKNVLGFFTYQEGNKPQSIEEVELQFVIFPNVSFKGSGGGLESGDKVNIGRFEKGTVISWFLLPNAWNGKSKTINDVNEIKYAINQFNDYTNPAFNQHTILLKDEARELLVLSFEDITRPNGDNDFNDAIFYLSANPFEAVDTSNLLSLKSATDTDNDGVQNIQDAFPDDPDRAYMSYWPAQNQFATILFEDQWPSVGDYDFNDLVADYNFTYVKAANGNVKELQIETVVKAVGGLKKSSLLFNLGIDQSLVESVSGSRLEYDFIKLNSNGTESGQQMAIIPIFDNSRSVLAPPTGFSVTNVYNNQPHVNTVSLKTTIIFKEPIAEQLINKYDPFIITEFNRGVEIHLPGQQPTDKADMSLFGSQDDASDFNEGFTYKNSRGLPWALHVMSSIKYPSENSDFANAYVNFRNWAESSGVTHTDWFYQNDNNMRHNFFYKQ